MKLSRSRKQKIFGIGLSKTGTTSLHAALEILGFKSCHYRHKDGPYAGKLLQLHHLKFYDAASDIQIAANFEELDRRYPGSKFVYTVRECNAWLASMCKASYYVGFWQGQKPNGPTFDFAARRPAGEYPKDGQGLRDESFDRLYCDRAGDIPPAEFNEAARRHWLKKYFEHDQRVFEYFKNRKQDILLFDVCSSASHKAKWQKLCNFLGCNVPQWQDEATGLATIQPFPHREASPYRWRKGDGRGEAGMVPVGLFE